MEFGPISGNIQDVFNLVEVTTVAQWVFDVDVKSLYPNVMTVLIYAGTLLTVLCLPNVHERMEKLRYNLLELLFTAIILAWAILSLEGVSTFLYFNF